MSPVLAGVRILSLHLKRAKLIGRLVHSRAATHGRWTVCFGQLICHEAVLGQGVVVCGAVHVCILFDALLTSLATDECSSHGAGYYAGANDEDGSSQHNPAAPLHMRDEEKDIDKEGEKSDEEGRESKDEEGEEVSRRMAWAMEVGGHSEAEAYQSEKGGDGVNNEDS